MCHFSLRHLAINPGMVMRRRDCYGMTFNPAFTARTFWRLSKVKNWCRHRLPSASLPFFQNNVGNDPIPEDGLGAGRKVRHLELGRGLGARRTNAGGGAGPVQHRHFLPLRDQRKDRAEVVMNLPNGDCLHVPQVSLKRTMARVVETFFNHGLHGLKRITRKIRPRSIYSSTHPKGVFQIIHHSFLISAFRAIRGFYFPS